MDKEIIVTCAFREPYKMHHAKQREVVTAEYIAFIDELPYSEGVVTEKIVGRFQKSLYGFKPHAIQHAIDLGYKKVLWFDPSILPTTPVSVLFDSLDTHPMLIRSGDTLINKMVNDKAVDYFGFKREDLDNDLHIGGTIYGFNFNDPKTVEVFNLWKQAEVDGIFGTQDDHMNGHWADEACMVLAMKKVGVKQYCEEKFTYLNQKLL